MWASEIDTYRERGLLSVEVAAPHAAAPCVSVWEGGREGGVFLLLFVKAFDG